MDDSPVGYIHQTSMLKNFVRSSRKYVSISSRDYFEASGNRVVNFFVRSTKLVFTERTARNCMT